MNQTIVIDAAHEPVSGASLRLAAVLATVSVADANSPANETLAGTVANGTVAPRPGPGFNGKTIS